MEGEQIKSSELEMWYILRKLGRIADLSCKLIYVPKPSCNGRNGGEDEKNVDVAITQLPTNNKNKRKVRIMVRRADRNFAPKDPFLKNVRYYWTSTTWNSHNSLGQILHNTFDIPHILPCRIFIGHAYCGRKFGYTNSNCSSYSIYHL